jgi:hypothetical protein
LAKRSVKNRPRQLLLHNSYLTGRLEQSVGEEKTKETAILSAVNKSLQVSKRLETAVKKKAQSEVRQLSYAEKKAVRPLKNVVIIRPEVEDGEIRTSEEACDAVFTLVNPRKEGI